MKLYQTIGSLTTSLLSYESVSRGLLHQLEEDVSFVACKDSDFQYIRSVLALLHDIVVSISPQSSALGIVGHEWLVEPFFQVHEWPEDVLKALLFAMQAAVAMLSSPHTRQDRQTGPPLLGFVQPRYCVYCRYGVSLLQSGPRSGADCTSDVKTAKVPCMLPLLVIPPPYLCRA